VGGRGVGFVRVCASGEKERKQEKYRGANLFFLASVCEGKEEEECRSKRHCCIFLKKKKRK